MTTEIEKEAHKYFKLFSTRNLDGLKELFDKDVTLRDWNINARGLKNVLDENKKIFEAVKELNVSVQSIFSRGKTVVAELEIIVDEMEYIKVVDILEFNERQKIISIKAFKG